MSFGFSVGDCVLLAQLAWSTYQGAKKACGEHDELTREVSSLYKVLNRLRKEISNPESLVSKASDDKRQELEEHAAGCEGILKTMNNVLTKYNGLTVEQRRGKKLWQKIKFANGQTKDLADIRIKLSAHTSAIMMSLNLCSLDSLGRVEATLGRIEARSTTHGEQLRGIRKALHWVTANMAAASGEGSVWTSYTNDDQTFWRELRRELAKEGYRSSTLQRHKRLIKKYVEELGNRGVFDDIVDFEGPPNEPDYVSDGDGVGTGQSNPTSEASTIDFIQEGDDVLLHSPDNFARSRTGLSGGHTALPMTAVSGTPTDNLQPVDKPSDDHDGGDQHNHASEGSHVGDTAGQDENDIPEIALMETTSVNGVAEVIENPSDVLDFESVEDLNLETTSIGDTLCIPASKASTIDEFEAKIDVPEQPSLPDLVLAAENHDLPLSDILVDDEDVEDLDSLDSLTSDGNNKLMTPMSESSIDTLDRVPEPQESSPSAASSSASLESVSTPQDGMESTDQVDSTGAPELRSHDKLMAVPVEPSCKARSPFAVQIEEVLDEEFVRYSRSDRLEELSITILNQDIPQPPTSPQERFASQDVDIILDPGVSGGDVSDVRSEARPPPTVEEVLDEDFSADAHPNVSTANITFDYSSDTGATLPWSDPVDSSSPGSTQQTKTSKRVRFADAESAQSKSEISSTKWAPEDLRFIFFRETRDFNSYRELQESYQALFDETEGYNAVDFSKPENTTTFITHSPYTPPATMFDLQYYRVPASYYHTFWHPQRVPIYLHGNVFDGISLTNWIYNWTAYTFKDNSYQMNAVRRLGKTVVKLGSALSDIEHAKPAVKAKLPRDLYDESGVLWADLENIINDIMSEAEDRLEASKQGGRLEVEFVSRFSHELIAGNKYYRPIEKFLKKTEAWCKKARFHPEFIMLWELWES